MSSNSKIIDGSKTKNKNKVVVLLILVVVVLIVCCLISSLAVFLLSRNSSSTSSKDKKSNNQDGDADDDPLSNYPDTNNPPVLSGEESCREAAHASMSYTLVPPHDTVYQFIKDKTFKIPDSPISTIKFGTYYPETGKISISVNGASSSCVPVYFTTGEKYFSISDIMPNYDLHFDVHRENNVGQVLLVRPQSNGVWEANRTAQVVS